jgi:hypothetical protein
MVGQPAFLQNSWTSGQIVVDLEARFDLKAWQKAARRMVNAAPIPQGGFELMPRSRYHGKGRKQMAVIAKTLITSNNGPSAATFVAREYSFNAGPRALSLVAIDGFKSDTDKDARLGVQWRDPTTLAWTPFGPNFDVSTDLHDRVAAKPPGAAVTADRIRVVISQQTAAVTMTIGNVRAWSENSAVIQKTVLRSFKFGAAEGYVFAYTAGPPPMIDIWRQGVHVGATLDTLDTLDKIRAARIAQQFDTLLQFHQEMVSERIMRRGGDHEWEHDPIPWDAIADVDLGGIYVKVNDKWEIYVRYVNDTIGADLYLNLIINGEETGGIQGDYENNVAGAAAAVQTAILALPSMKPGVTVAGANVSDHAKKLTITFGGENSGIRFQVVSQIVNTADAAAFATHTQIGDPGGEPIMSATAQWPGAAAFFQDRLVPGGYFSKPAGITFSRVGEYFDLNIDAVGPETAAYFNIGNTGAETIRNIYAGRHLMIFTDSALYFVSTPTIDKTQPVNFTFTDRTVAHPNAEVIEVDNEIFFLSRDGEQLYATGYDDVRTRYVANPASLLSSELVAKCHELSWQRPASETDASVMYLGRSDGRLVLAYVIRGEEILGFCEWSTDGTVDSVVVEEVENKPYVAVTRRVGNQDEVFIESLERDLLFDAVVTQDFSLPQTAIGNLAMHEGRTVWALADGYVVGPFVVAQGAINLDVPATSVTVGRWTPPLVESLPLLDIKNAAAQVVQIQPGRIFAVDCFVIDTTSIAIGANGRRPREVALYRYGMPVDQPPPKVTKQLHVNGIKGFSEEPTVTITQLRPGYLHVRDAGAEAAL